ncbi:cytochrome d ubiquinol oxidase subunit II [Variovorax sp. GT1P44]|uniref:cytochrome d ubiquinol oxidase subunit II n=1 Tax=Variovorax sp. GT1P44 TaxID=3443742 RepID=UPI003F459C0D
MNSIQPSDLALFWATVIAVSILVYVVLDGFDLGVGILFGTTNEEDHRLHMMDTIAPFWDGNETWLVIIGAGLFATFPVVYAVFLGAFYLPAYAVTVGSAAAPDPSLQFLFYGGVVVLPVIATYTFGVYWVFRGKVRGGYR